MIVATAGHIDHGKTLLVKALSGVDTDRLPEEKSRGISIDLGFAYLPTPDGGLLGFVDVPGHERFIRNMLAGVCGIDLALLVVAADDGIMPQTVEHLQILDLLNVSRAIAVISMPGDRLDADIAAFGRLSAQTFDELVIREDTNTRGRPSGEIAARLKDAAMSAGLSDVAVTIVLEEIDAVKTAVERSDRDDLVVLMVDKPAQTWEELNNLAGAFTWG